MTSRRPKSRGVVLLGLVVALAVASLAALNFTESGVMTRQREREQQLLWVGQQYRQALESYYLATPGPAKFLPVRLEDLIRDPRFPQPVRHLRQLYADPLAPDIPWGVVKRGSQIIGIYSQADGTPIRRSDMPRGLESLAQASSYADWRFIFMPRTVVSAASAPAPGPRPGHTPNHP